MSTKSFDDPTEHIQTLEAFDAEVQALVARAFRSGDYPPLIETPIWTVEQITDEFLDLVASGSPRPAKGTPTFLAKALGAPLGAPFDGGRQCAKRRALALRRAGRATRSKGDGRQVESAEGER